MGRIWAAMVMTMALVVGVTACSSSSGSSSSALPTIDRKGWTTAGLAEANATVKTIATAQPGQCADPAPNDFSKFPISMKQFNSTVVPLAQVLCTVNSEIVEISVFTNTQQRDRYIEDRSTGLCDRAKAQAVQYKKPQTFPGLRWAVGAGNISVQPDSEGTARDLAAATKGAYLARPCATGMTIDWDGTAVTALHALGTRIAATGKGCDSVELVGRETLIRTRTFTNRQLPAALGHCTFAGAPIELMTFTRRTPQVDTFLKGRIAAACTADPAVGHIDGPGYLVLAGGTIAEQAAAATGGTLAATSCGTPAKP